MRQKEQEMTDNSEELDCCITNQGR